MLSFLKSIKYSMDFFFRDQTPPNTPQRVRTAARQSERDNRTLDSPEHRRIPDQPIFPQIQPLQFNNIPVPQLLPPPQNPIAIDDPFGLPAINPQQYQHLPPDIAQRLATLPPLQPVQGRGRGRGRGNRPLPPPVCIFYLFF